MKAVKVKGKKLNKVKLTLFITSLVAPSILFISMEFTLIRIKRNRLCCSSFTRKSKGGVTCIPYGAFLRGLAIWFIVNISFF